MRVTIYSKPNCVQCNATYKAMDKTGVPYNVVDLSQDEQALAAVTELGYQQAPVTIISNGDSETDLHWSGFHPTNINKYIKKAA